MQNVISVVDRLLNGLLFVQTEHFREAFVLSIAIIYRDGAQSGLGVATTLRRNEQVSLRQRPCVAA